MLEILRLLEEDGRLTVEQIAERTGKNAAEVRLLIKEAEIPSMGLCSLPRLARKPRHRR